MTILLNGILQGNTSSGLATQSYVQTALTESGPLGGFRNLLINGDMKVAQRATSGALSTGSYLSLDRWYAGQATSANGVLTQVSAALTGFQYAAKFGRNSGATTTGVLFALEALETINSIPLQGQTVTLSFWAKAGANYSGGSLTGTVITGTGTDQSSTTVFSWPGYATPVISSSLSLNATWQRFTITGTIPTTATQLCVYFAWTPTGTAGADDNVYITGIQLEEGAYATPFELRPYQTELALCQRYYEIGSIFYQVSGVSSSAGTTIGFSTVKRANTTNVFSGVTYSNASGLTDVSATYLTTRNSNIAFYITPSTSNGYVSFSWSASAEL